MNDALRVEIIDTQGRLVHKITAMAQNEVMDVPLPASLPSGPYLLRYIDGAGTHTLPFDLVR